MQPIITGQPVPAKTGVTLMARVRGQAGQLATQASLASIAYTAQDLTTGTQIGTGTLTIAAVVFDSLQQGDIRWTLDDANNLNPQDKQHGYNFLWTVPASLLQNGGDRYRVDVLFTPVAGEPFKALFEFLTLKVYP